MIFFLLLINKNDIHLFHLWNNKSYLFFYLIIECKFSVNFLIIYLKFDLKSLIFKQVKKNEYLSIEWVKSKKVGDVNQSKAHRKEGEKATTILKTNKVRAYQIVSIEVWWI